LKNRYINYTVGVNRIEDENYYQLEECLTGIANQIDELKSITVFSRINTQGTLLNFLAKNY